MLIRTSHPLTQDEYAAMQVGAQVLEQDERGPKVWLLADNTILKIFRPRSRWSRDTLYSNARSFCRNADRLLALGIPTVTILKLFAFENSIEDAVLYQPLPGTSLRHLLEAKAITQKVCQDLGAFVANLHQQGIYFRSLHFGNILLTDDQKIGLIDIADMNIYWWRLQLHTRIRNFIRIQKYHKDMLLLGQENRLAIMDAYVQNSNLSKKQVQKLLNNIVYQAHLHHSEG